MIGFGALWPLARNRTSALARVGAVAAGLVSVVWVGLALSAALELRQATQLFAWRLAPHAELLLQAAACAVALRVVVEPRLARRWNAASLATLVGGVCLLATRESLDKNKTLASVVADIFLVAIGVALIGMLVSQVWKNHRLAGLWGRAAPWLSVVAAAILAFQVGKPHLKLLKEHSTLINGIHPNDRALTEWMRDSTPKDALFLTPPGIETLRYHGQRAIVVDWKSNPIVPGEVLEWLRRLEDVCGRPVRGAGDMRGYDVMDRRRLDHLKDEYKLDFAIVMRGRERGLGYPVVWSNRAFVVLDLRQPS